MLYQSIVDLVMAYCYFSHVKNFLIDWLHYSYILTFSLSSLYCCYSYCVSFCVLLDGVCLSRNKRIIIIIIIIINIIIIIIYYVNRTKVHTKCKKHKKRK